MTSRCLAAKVFVFLVLCSTVEGETTAPPGSPSRTDADSTVSAPSTTSSNDAREAERKFEAAVAHKMEEKVAWHFHGEKLADFVAQLRKEMGVPVVLDQNAFAQSSANAAEPIRQDLDGLSREAAVEMVLKQFDMDWRIAGEAILIGLVEDVQKDLPTRVYDVDDLVNGEGFEGADCDGLIDVIESTVMTDTWAENGGREAEIRPLRVHGKYVLVISQTRRAHQKIRQLLVDLESVPEKGAGRKPLSKPKQAANDDANGNKRSDDAGVKAFEQEASELAAAARRNNAFSIALFQQVVAKSTRNELVCGHGARELMRLAALGSRQETRVELEKVLNLPSDPSTADRDLQLLRTYVDRDSSGENLLDVANSIWFGPELAIKESFVQQAVDKFNATTNSIDFAQPARAARVMNQWAAEKTHGRITKVVEPNEITAETNLYLMNAVYFLGKWRTQFDPKATDAGEFTLLTGTKTNVPMMTGELAIRIGFDGATGTQLLELPFRGRGKSMLIALPAPGEGELTKLTIGLTAEQLDRWRSATHRDTLRVYLPRFVIHAEHTLNEPLVALGASRIFDPGMAQFTGITDHPTALRKVKQVAYIKVDESGAEAAAVTTAGSFGGGPKSHEIKVDRPFLFFILDRTTGCSLFTGQVYDPGT